MIRSLRKKFILVAMCSTMAVLSVILGVILLLSYSEIVSEADGLLEMLGQNHGEFPEDLLHPGSPDEDIRKPLRVSGDELPQGETNPEQGDSRFAPHEKKHPFFTEETPYETRFFSVLLDENGEKKESDLQRIVSVSEEEAVSMAQLAARGQKTAGFSGGFRYGVFRSDDGSCRVIFVDCSKSLRSFGRTVLITLLVSAAGLLLVFLLVAVFSRIVFRPVEESDRKQKQFITDASHELKTPLAIIDANTEVLELTAGENEWTASIRHQVERLTELVQQMVTLTRMDEGNLRGQITDFSLSEAVADTAEFFAVPAEIQGKEIRISVEPDISMHGDEAAVRQLVSLLLDNAVKYSAEGAITVSLSRKGKKKILEVSNPVEEIEKGSQDILFERFYRRDSSRSQQTGGSGIGLSVAKAIVQLHGGNIHAVSPDGKMLRITAELTGI